jgi:hypothetical protein
MTNTATLPPLPLPHCHCHPNINFPPIKMTALPRCSRSSHCHPATATATPATRRKQPLPRCHCHPPAARRSQAGSRSPARHPLRGTNCGTCLIGKMAVFNRKMEVFHGKMEVFHGKLMVFYIKMMCFHWKMMCLHRKMMVFI